MNVPALALLASLVTTMWLVLVGLGPDSVSMEDRRVQGFPALGRALNGLASHVLPFCT